MKPDFPSDAFAGTASYYTRYRVPYPAELFLDLKEHCRVTGTGILLDLASGPGRVALDLAPSFWECLAVDIEPEMIAEGKSEAAHRKIGNIKWITSPAETLEVPAASIELITIGDAFHRLDQATILGKARRWLKPGGCLAILGCDGILNEKEPWQRVVMEIARRWLKSGRPKGAKVPVGTGPSSGPAHCENILQKTDFMGVAHHSFVASHSWTVETIIGYLYSTSFCSRNAMRGNADAFEDDLRATLLAYDPVGTYCEQVRFGYTIGRTPRGDG
jgi:SAM-dependent methyltransferase